MAILYKTRSTMASSNFVFVAEQIQDPRRNQMFNSQSIQLSRTRYLVAATVLLVLLAAAPLAVDASSYSGDGTYDRAAGGFPELFLTSVPTSYSGDDAYDQAAGGIPELFVVAAVWSLSGDDAYDPAAGGLSELAGNAIEARPLPVVRSLYPASESTAEMMLMTRRLEGIPMGRHWNWPAPNNLHGTSRTRESEGLYGALL
jgi:hypothetical protein